MKKTKSKTTRAPSRSRNHVVFTLNGTLQKVEGAHAGVMLSDYLREIKRLTGTKIVCAEGDCGACSVLRLAPMRAAYSGSGEKPSLTSQKSQAKRFLPINSCITTVAQMDGSHLVTVDALANPDQTLSPVQKAMVESHGSQCGFCTPGFVIALTGLVEKKLCEGKTHGTCSAKEIKNATTGNLCRCTGYQPIIEAGEQIHLEECESIQKRFVSPAHEKLLQAAIKVPVEIKTSEFEFCAPKKALDVSKHLLKRPESKIVTAGTDLGVVMNKGKLIFKDRVSLHLIPELYQIQQNKSSFKVGARVTLSELRRAIQPLIPEIANFLDLFAAPPIKNVASLVGNVSTASPIGDTPPFLLAHYAKLHIQGPKGKRTLLLEKFYLGYRKTALKRGEWITAIEFELPKKNESLRIFKASQRKDLDISAVNAAFRIQWQKGKIQNATLAMGGVAATPLRLYQTEALLNGVTPHQEPEKLQAAANKLQEEISPLSDLRGSAEFRRLLAKNLFFKFFREVEPV
jgi:xanthine dehydrogenase small subunit